MPDPTKTPYVIDNIHVTLAGALNHLLKAQPGQQLDIEGFEIRPFADVDVILIDEAHNFRNRLANRYRTLETILAANGRRGRDGGCKKLTPSSTSRNLSWS